MYIDFDRYERHSGQLSVSSAAASQASRRRPRGVLDDSISLGTIASADTSP